MSYTTQMDAAAQGVITPQMRAVAEKEHIAPETLRAGCAPKSTSTSAFRATAAALTPSWKRSKRRCAWEPRPLWT